MLSLLLGLGCAHLSQPEAPRAELPGMDYVYDLARLEGDAPSIDPAEWIEDEQRLAQLTFGWRAEPVCTTSACLPPKVLDAALAAGALEPEEALALSDAKEPGADFVEQALAARQQAIVAAAIAYLGRQDLGCPDQRNDCSGYVSAVYADAQLDLAGRSTRGLAELADALDVDHVYRRPFPGDLAFFVNTWDRNHDGLVNDGITHVAVVETVDADGTVTLIHKGGSGVRRTTMNLLHPDAARSPEGKLWNSVLRVRQANDAPGLEVLTGQLWVMNASFAAAEELQLGYAAR
jgi:hypothetical protein